MIKNWLIVFTLFLYFNYSNAQVSSIIKDTLKVQNTNQLNGLKKAGLNDIDPSIPLMLDGVTTPVFSENFSLIQGDEFIKTMMSGDYIPEPFIDSNKVVKAFVLRKATQEEKMQMVEMHDDIENKNDLIGKTAFPFSVIDLFGNNFSLEKLKGKVIVINFWFIECKPCVMEMPELNQLVEKYKNKDVVFLGFANNEKTKIENFLKTKSYKYNIIANNNDLLKLYNVNSFPTHLVIDKNSVVSYYVSGLGPTTISDLDKIIELLIK